MILFAFGSVDTDSVDTGSARTGGDRIEPSGASSDEHTDPRSLTTTTPSNSANDPAVDRILGQRTAEYQAELARWNAANEARDAARTEKKKLESELLAQEGKKPSSPTFEQREWVSFDGNYKTIAVLVDTDKETANLRKSDGKTVTVERDRLNLESRLYITKAFNDLNHYRIKLSTWEQEKKTLEKRLVSVNQRITSPNKPKPHKPSRQSAIEEVAAAEAMQREYQRLAKEQAAREATEAAARKAEEELDRNGLVLLRKSVSGRSEQFGGKITGIVENRRSRKLGYAQISFNLYDDSGAQVGSAVDNINGLEPGGKWKFEASSLGKEFTTYKFSELTGY